MIDIFVSGDIFQFMKGAKKCEVEMLDRKVTEGPKNSNCFQNDVAFTLDLG